MWKFDQVVFIPDHCCEFFEFPEIKAHYTCRFMLGVPGEYLQCSFFDVELTEMAIAIEGGQGVKRVVKCEDCVRSKINKVKLVEVTD